MRIMIASDIHGSAKYCRLLLERFREEKAGRLILLGDILYHGPRNDRTASQRAGDRCGGFTGSDGRVPAAYGKRLGSV